MARRKTPRERPPPVTCPRHKEFNRQTVNLLFHKYMYYERDQPLLTDFEYDQREKAWYKLGRELGLLSEDEISPCVGFDRVHPRADKVYQLARTHDELFRNRQNRDSDEDEISQIDRLIEEIKNS